MNKPQKFHSTSSITFMTLFLVLSGCTDNSVDEVSLTSGQEVDESVQQTIQTQNYSISVDESSDQKLFSVSTLDGDIVVSMASADELLSDYPGVFDELAMHDVTSGASTSNYSDDPSMNREVIKEL